MTYADGAGELTAKLLKLGLKPTLRQVHVAGEKLFVDYSGHTMEVIDGLTGEVIATQIFVAVLGASNYTYAEATFTQRLRPRE